MADIIDTTTQEAPAATEAATKEKSFTQAELNAHIEARLIRERKDAAEKIKTAVTEAEKLAKMSADERHEHERQAHEKELLDREQGITKRELRAQALELLGEKRLPRVLADLLPYVDADGTMAAVDAVEKVFREAVEQGVTERLKGNPPKIGQAVPAMSAKDKLIKEYDEAAKNGDAVKMMILDARIKQLKE